MSGLLVRHPVTGTGPFVVKIGSALLTEGAEGLAHDRLADWAGQLAQLREQSVPVVVVSSGAVAEGCARLGLTARPRRLHRLQAAAAVGQVGLAEAYERSFSALGLRTAMVLLTHEDLASRERYLNARSTLNTLLQMGVVPIINENDTVATQEIRLGDNDTLAAMVANLVQAQRLLILTDRDGIHQRDPAQDPQAPVFDTLSLDDPALDAAIGPSRSAFGSGGMHTKVTAARAAARSGAVTVIANGRAPSVIAQVAAGAPVGTWLADDKAALAARKGWLLSQKHVDGTLTVDAGAARALAEQGVSLLPVGVTAVAGNFRRGDLVRIRSADGRDLAQGLINYASEEAARLVGVASGDIAAVLGYTNEEEMVHRDNMALLPA
ncbi:MAG: glutamate 5-kinase [Pseudomonadota bacterium]